MQFAPLDGNEFGVLIQKIFQNCEECDLQEGSLIICPMDHLCNLDNAPLDAILKKCKRKYGKLLGIF